MLPNFNLEKTQVSTTKTISALKIFFNVVVLYIQYIIRYIYTEKTEIIVKIDRLQTGKIRNSKIHYQFDKFPKEKYFLHIHIFCIYKFCCKYSVLKVLYI